MHGKTGELFTIKVPVGTVVKQLPLQRDTGEEVHSTTPSRIHIISFLCHFPHNF
jgi:GTPase involved in cell partitioning and DNA repair